MPIQKPRIVFKLKGKELCAISAKGAFVEEIGEIKGLLAYENNVKPDEIKAVYLSGHRKA